MSWLLKLFSTTNNAETIVKEGMTIIDDAFHTDEEKAREKANMVQVYYKILESTKYMSVARRVIAFSFVGSYLLLIFISCLGYVVNATWSDRVTAAILDWLKQPVSIIVGFYFLQAIVKTGFNGKK